MATEPMHPLEVFDRRILLLEEALLGFALCLQHMQEENVKLREEFANRQQEATNSPQIYVPH
jgi:hypothetical protein